MLTPPAFRRIRHRFFRLHCQFISGNERRAPYDYFMLTLGPVPFERQARTPEGAARFIAPDGALTDAPAGPPQAVGSPPAALAEAGAR